MLLMVMWIRSYWAVDRIERHSKTGEFVLVHWLGNVYVAFNDFTGTPPTPVRWKLQTARKFSPVSDRGVDIGTPYWFLMAFAATIGYLPWVRWRFSLSTLLIVVTLIALLLGMISIRKTRI
jgi:hypothetical protein